MNHLHQILILNSNERFTFKPFEPILRINTPAMPMPVYGYAQIGGFFNAWSPQA